MLTDEKHTRNFLPEEKRQRQHPYDVSSQFYSFAQTYIVYAPYFRISAGEKKHAI